MSMKILVVDSDWRFVSSVRDLLEPRGNYVIDEGDPDKALQRSLKWRPDVVMISTDYDSCCDGDLLVRFAQLRPRPAILLTSDLADFGKAWRAWQHGGDEVLFKPMLHPSELHVAISIARQNAICPSRRPVKRPLAMSA